MASSRPGSARKRFELKNLRKDVPAGVVLGVESVPDGLAGGLLAGVNPIYGLYGYLWGTLFGAFATSSAFMAVQATGAMAVVVSDIPQVQGDDAESATALFTLAVLTGLVMLGLGLARLGGMIRWVPNSVLVGFVNAVAINIILGQLGNFTGFSSDGDGRIARAFDTAFNLGSWSWVTVAVGAITIVLIVLLERTRIGALGMVVAVVVGSALVPLLNWTDVEQLRDITSVPSSLPTPQWPAFGLTAELLIPAISLAFVGLVQGAAISRSFPNPDGKYPDPSGDFRGQGVANIASGLLQGMPVGGSMSATSIVTNAKARSRVALVVAGFTIMICILLLSDLVGYIAMPALAGLLIVVGFRTLKPDDVLTVAKTGSIQVTVMTVTFVLTLVIPLQYAVLTGIGTSVLLFVIRQSNRVRVVRWRFTDDGSWYEEEPPATLGQEELVVLRPYGSLFFAAAPLVAASLPSVTPETRRCGVVLTLRGKEDLGSTFLGVVTDYAEELQAADSELFLAGVSEDLRRQLEQTGALHVIGEDNVFLRTRVVSESTKQALSAAESHTAG